VLAFETGRARIQRHFLLTITANEKLPMLALTANELAFIAVCSRFILAGSDYLQMKPAKVSH